MSSPLEILQSSYPEIFARPDTTEDQSIHTAVILDCANKIACEEPDSRAIAQLGGYLSLYAAGVSPAEAFSMVTDNEAAA